MATQLILVNKILERLREAEVSTVSETTYSKLIARFLNDAKNDLEDTNHTWSGYETEIDITILSDGTRNYSLTATNDRAFLLRDKEEDRIPLAFDITASEHGQLFDCPLKDLRRERALTNTITDVEIPKVFAIQADNTIDGWQIQLLWGANTTRTWRTYWYVPQDDLLTDGTDDANSYILPDRPIEMRAEYYALNERGEEMGEPNGIAWKRSVDSMSASLETDLQVQKKSDELDITNREYL